MHYIGFENIDGDRAVWVVETGIGSGKQIVRDGYSPVCRLESFESANRWAVGGMELELPLIDVKT